MSDYWEFWGDRLARMEHKLDVIARNLGITLAELKHEGEDIMSLRDQVARARADIQESKRVQDGAVILLKTVVQSLNDLKSKVEDPETLAALDDTINTLEQNTQNFANDLAANTPADPNAPPPAGPGPEPAPAPTPVGGAMASGRPVPPGAGASAAGVSSTPAGPGRPRTPVR